MNIHITDKELFKGLLASSFVKIEVGSTMYRLGHKGSDLDLLCIYHTSDRELVSMDMSHHQLQYKHEDIDYLFISIHSFLRNCMSGDSTINFEVINSDKLVGTSLEFLYLHRLEFYTYKVLRSYLGLAKRDLKRISIDANTNFGKNKKVSHAYRGLYSARAVFNKTNVMMGDKELDFIRDFIWKFGGYSDRNLYVNDLANEIDDFRKHINMVYDLGEIASYMSIYGQRVINESLEELLNDSDIKMYDFDMGLFYDANLNGINY